MAQFQGKIASAAAAIDWTNIIGAGELAEGAAAHIVVRTHKAARVAVGVADPVASNTAGVATVAGEAVEVILGSEAANQFIWVQTPADQTDVFVEVDELGTGKAIAAFS